MSNSIILECEDLSKSFLQGQTQLQVLDGVNLQLEQGQSLAIVGASGSGKSTLLHCLGGLDEPTAGQVKLSGEILHQLSEVKRGKLRNDKLGFVYQFHHLLPEFTALENVAMPLLIGGVERDIASEKAKELLAQVGLEQRVQHRPAELSGGERQRAAIARAMVNQPACIMADEPTGNLDRQTAGAVFELFLEMNKNSKTSLIVVTHDMEIAKKMDTVVTLIDGKLQ